jgi:CBS domain-containing protein
MSNCSDPPGEAGLRRGVNERRRSGVDSATVADAMITEPKVCSAATSVGQARACFADEHVHTLLIVARGVLVAAVERADVACCPPEAAARSTGRLHGRVVVPTADLGATWQQMAALGRRRLAVVEADGTLAGLLCLKSSGHGFCSESDVHARAAEGRGSAPDPGSFPAGSCAGAQAP